MRAAASEIQHYTQCPERNLKKESLISPRKGEQKVSVKKENEFHYNQRVRWLEQKNSPVCLIEITW